MRKKLLTKIILPMLLFMQPCNILANNVYATSSVQIDNTNVDNSQSNSVDIDKFNKSINAETYVVIDSKTGNILMGKDETKKMYPASLTKIMTSLLLLESGKINDMFTVSADAAKIGESSIYVQQGEQISGKDLLYAMMLQSANDACYVTGEGISGDITSFYNLMTQRAHEIGSTDSNFKSSNGLHDPEHITTALDLALITKEALKYEEFRECIKTKSYSLTRESDSTMKNITNKNRMLFDYKPEYNEYSIGGKTAYTTPAGNCLMEVAKKDDMEIIVITMKSPTIYTDTSKIINFALENYSSYSLLDKDKISTEYKDTIINLYTKESIGIVKDKTDSRPNVTTEVVLNDKYYKEITKDQKVGVVNIYLEGELYKTLDVFSKEDYVFDNGLTMKFILNLVLFSSMLILIKIIINLIKIRKQKTKDYLKNSKFY